MLLGFLIIWSLLFVVLKYDLKQNNITSIVRATCFTLISYIVLDIQFKECFKDKDKDKDSNNKESNSTGPIETPDTTTVDESSITTQANTFETTEDKCNYIEEQQRLTVNSLYQDFKKLKNSTSINDTQINVLQNNFNDLITVKQVGDVCFN